MSPDPVAVLGVGMHPWGKWGRPFREYGVHAAVEALKDAGVAWEDVQFVAGGETVRSGYPGYIAASTFAQALGWNGARVVSSYSACATGATASKQLEPEFWQACAMSLWSSEQTRHRKASCLPFRGSDGTIPTGCDFDCSEPRTHPISPCTRDAGWSSTEPLSRLRPGESEECTAWVEQSECTLPETGYRRGCARLSHGRGSTTVARYLLDVRWRRRDRIDVYGFRTTSLGCRLTRPDSRDIHGDTEISQHHARIAANLG